MFQSIEYIKYGYDKKAREYTYKVKIIDTDFEDIVVLADSACVSEVSIIDCYTERGLPVAPNLFRHMRNTEINMAILSINNSYGINSIIPVGMKWKKISDVSLVELRK